MVQINRVLSRIKRCWELPGGDFSRYLFEKREATMKGSIMLLKGRIIANEYNGGETKDSKTGTGSSVLIFKVTFSEWQQRSIPPLIS